jgi:hypothetical protein
VAGRGSPSAITAFTWRYSSRVAGMLNRTVDDENVAVSRTTSHTRSYRLTR